MEYFVVVAVGLAIGAAAMLVTQYAVNKFYE